MCKRPLRWVYFGSVILGLIVGCGGPHGHIKAGASSKVSLGMTKLEVVRILGEPEHVKASGNEEVLSYILERPWWQDRPFHVVIKDGKVTSYKVIESAPSQE